MGRFEGKVVLVTGGNRNTGLDIVERFAREGATVYMCGSSEDSTAKGAAELKARGLDGIISRPCDISDAGQVDALFNAIEKGSGRLDILVNNAANQGIGHGGPLEMKPEMFYDVFKTNVMGGFRVTQAACNRFFMKKPYELPPAQGGEGLRHSERRRVSRIGRLRQHGRRDRHMRRRLLVSAHARRRRYVNRHPPTTILLP